MTTMMPDIFGNYGPDPMLQQRPQGLDAILMPLQGIQGPLQQIVEEMPSQINSYVDEEIQRRMDEMKSTPSPAPTPTDPVGPPQDPFQPPMPRPFPFPMPRPFPGMGGIRPFPFQKGPRQTIGGIGRYRDYLTNINNLMPRPIAGLPSIFG